MGFGSTYNGTAGAWAAGSYFSVSGSQSVVGTNGATFYITGVQLEKGSVATPFDFRFYGKELLLCQRYYYRFNAGAQYTPYGSGYTYSTTLFTSLISFPVQMRAVVTGIETSGAANFYVQNSVSNYTPSALVFSRGGYNSATLNATIPTTTAGQGGQLFDNQAGASYIGFTGAEL
jgi:hypothetical protein